MRLNVFDHVDGTNTCFVCLNLQLYKHQGRSVLRLRIIDSSDRNEANEILARESKSVGFIKAIATLKFQRR